MRSENQDIYTEVHGRTDRGLPHLRLLSVLLGLLSVLLGLLSVLLGLLSVLGLLAILLGLLPVLLGLLPVLLLMVFRVVLLRLLAIPVHTGLHISSEFWQILKVMARKSH